MSSVHSQTAGSDSGARDQRASSVEVPRPEPGEMSQTGAGRGSGNTMTGEDVTRVDEMPIEMQQEVYVLPAASRRKPKMARVVKQELPTYRGESPPNRQRQDSSREWPVPEMARVVSRRRTSRSRSRSSSGGWRTARVVGRRSISPSRIGAQPNMARVSSRSRTTRSRSWSRQRGKRHCMRFRTRRRGMARVVGGVTAPGSREKSSQSELFRYKEYSSLLATDSDFLVFKRFGASNARVLLALQDDVMRKERALADIEMAVRQSVGPEKERIHIARFSNEAGNAIEELYSSLDRYSLFFLCRCQYPC